MRWLAVRLDIISIALITTTGLMIVLMHGQIPPGYAGLAISYAVQVSMSTYCNISYFMWLLPVSKSNTPFKTFLHAPEWNKMLLPLLVMEGKPIQSQDLV